MSYEMAFIMVGRVLAWGVLILAVPAVFCASGGVQKEDPESASLLWWCGLFLYAAVILCVRYVP